MKKSLVIPEKIWYHIVSILQYHALTVLFA